jgi:hypothetical protein
VSAADALLFVTRSFWQELAWLLSAVFWCALGALCFCLLQPDPSAAPQIKTPSRERLHY